MGYISRIFARQILDSRGNPTLEVDLVTDRGVIGRASIPSGVSAGKYEAVELRDKDKGRFLGKGVLKAIYNINKVLNDELKGIFVADQVGIDQTMINIDDTDNKSHIGANAILAVSLAAAKAAALTTGQPFYRYIGGINANILPVPMINILNGGVHTNSKLDIQEFMIMPTNANTFSDALRMGVEVFHSLENILNEKGLFTNVGDKGGFAPNLKSNEQAIELIIKAIEKAGYKAGQDIYIAIDAAASEFYNNEEKVYLLPKDNQKLTTNEMINYWETLIKKYPIVSIEDGLDQDDWAGWAELNKIMGNTVQLVGDDLFVTNTQRLAKAIMENVANSILIKPNQIGTLTETINTVQLALKWGYTSIISYRSGETEDTTIAELAVALNTGLIKTGSVYHTEHTAKYNQLLRIEETLGSSARYTGREFKYLR
ncbi:MAG: phosphopyruvate hydratase [Bacteroidetes bacterium CG23_combo_of_CG06-09_8_20_14_all_32_9]|nr:MAG: phosphopyruvate hydratase [Bacteroidetes bacterium CG23_combo_of_CG06-09_8_20_14_all_32_9]